MSTLGVYLRGVLMGAADIVPGVSGGTMAFITGIYDRLLASIRAFDLQLIRHLLRADVRSAWAHVDGGFLLALTSPGTPVGILLWPHPGFGAGAAAPG